MSVDATDRQTLTGGTRFSSVEVGLAATAFSPAADVKLDDFSADLGWTLDLTGTIQLVANLGYGFRAPNVSIWERSANDREIDSTFRTPISTPNGLRSLTRVSAIAAIGRAVNWWHGFSTTRIPDLVLTGDQTPGGRDVVQTQNGPAPICGESRPQVG